MTGKEFIALIALIIMVLNVGYYIHAIVRKKIKAHGFSWVVWFLTQSIAGAAQLAKGGGLGGWLNVIGGAANLVIALLAFFYYGEKSITRSDWISLAASLLAIPLWLITQDPLWSALLVSFIDTVGLFPTYRKSWIDPHQESRIMFACAAFCSSLSIIVLESYSLTTLAYPVCMGLTNFGLVGMLVFRRRVLQGRILKEGTAA